MPLPIKTFSDAGYDAGFLMSEAPGRISREQVLLAARATDTIAGTVLGKVLLGAATVTPAAQAGNVGNGSIGAPTADAGAPAGVYRVAIVAAAANAGKFEVEGPDGAVVGAGNVAVAFNGPINFTLADGSTDFAVGDAFTVTVAYAAGSGQVALLNLAATSGAQIADCILLLRQAANESAAKRCAVVARDCEVNGNLLIWPAGITTDQKKAAEAQLAAKGILVRY